MFKLPNFKQGLTQSVLLHSHPLSPYLIILYEFRFKLSFHILESFEILSFKQLLILNAFNARSYFCLARSHNRESCWTASFARISLSICNRTSLLTMPCLESFTYRITLYFLCEVIFWTINLWKWAFLLKRTHSTSEGGSRGVYDSLIC